MYIEEIYYKQLVRIIMEAWQVPNLQGGLVAGQAGKQMQSEDSLPEISLLLEKLGLFFLFRLTTNWMRPTPILESNLLYSKSTTI